MSPDTPTVTVAIPVLNEAQHIEACLESVAAQRYRRIVEVLVIDGGSIDTTRELATRFPGVRILDNPDRIQAAALNLALAQAQGEVVVRVDGHCRLAVDYVDRCVAALEETGAAMVGGAMRPVGEGRVSSGIAKALTSRLGSGPARFHVGGPSGFVDTVYLGAFRRSLAVSVGGYAEGAVTNEDAEFAIRMRPHGGIWFDARIASTYTPRSDLAELGRQFFRYGGGRAATVLRHPASLSARQLAAPLLVLMLLTPWRLPVIGAYLTALVVRTLPEWGRDPWVALGFTLAMPTMHLPWGVGFLRGLIVALRQPPQCLTTSVTGVGPETPGGGLR
jgi:glycosyltransferase involved in cell wall biosynthesis